MAKAVFLTWTNPADGADETEFNSWYDGTHVPELKAAIPSLTAVHRYQTAIGSVGAGPGQTPYRYVAIYELDSEDVDKVAETLNHAIASGKVVMTELLDISSTPPVMQFYVGV